MTTTSGLLIIVLVCAFLALNLHTKSASGSPIHSSQTVNKEQDLAPKWSSEKQAYQAEDAQQVTELSTSDEEQQTAKAKAIADSNGKQKQQQQRPVYSVAPAEKLRRGLSNFMNHLNPAHYFVPTLPQQQGVTRRDQSSATKKSPQSSSPELAAIVNGDSSSDTLIKGRLALMRPIGGPMRWGR